MASILVIDDSKVQRTLARLICEEAGHQVVEASDGTEGVAAAVDAASGHNLILLDLQMPDMSGQDVLRALAGRGVTTPVIVLTADDAAPIQEECLALGAALAVQKPADPAELISLVNSVLAKVDTSGPDKRESS
jgi:two-component system chemotaxis response regulator CheY